MLIVSSGAPSFFDGADGPSAGMPVPGWGWRAPASRAMWRWGWVLLGLAVIIGVIAAISYQVDDSVGSRTDREAVVVGATITAIHVRDDFIRPSTFQVDLDRPVAGRQRLTLQTDIEDEHHVGEHVQVEVDPAHLSLSALRGDANGPAWTLPGESLGTIGGVGFALAGIAVLGLSLRSRNRSQNLGEWTPLAAAVEAARQTTPANSASPPRPDLDNPVLIDDLGRRKRRIHRGMACGLGLLLLSGVLALFGGSTVRDLALRFGGGFGALMFMGSLADALALRRVSRAEPDWRPALVVPVVRGSRRLHHGIAVSTDDAHGAIYGPLWNASNNRVDASPLVLAPVRVWVTASGTGLVVAINEDGEDDVLPVRPRRAWQLDDWRPLRPDDLVVRRGPFRRRHGDPAPRPRRRHRP